MTDDYISRQAAIYIIEREIELSNRALDMMELAAVEREKFLWGIGLLESIVEDVKELQSAQQEQRWIPCSERLPENCQYVLVTFSKYKWVDTDEFDDGRFCYHKYVTAWMPLPEPYRGL